MVNYTQAYAPKNFSSHQELLAFIEDDNNDGELYLKVAGYDEPQLVTSWNIFSDGPWAVCGNLNGGFGQSFTVSIGSQWFTKINAKT